jgi:membrane protein YqaA with SNARE-associated domain
LLFLLTVLIIGAVFLRDRLGDFAALGYGGAFLVALIGAGSIVIPTPTLPVVFALGATTGYLPLLVGLAAGIGETIGETSGYAVGRGAAEQFHGRRLFRWLRARMARWGWLIVFAVSAVPNPIVKIATAAAGAAEMPYRSFVVWVALGKNLKMIAIAYAGAAGFQQVMALLGQSPPS